MCGIAGILWDDRRPSEETQSIVRAMNAALAHRGPDGEGTLVGDAAGLELRRWDAAGSLAQLARTFPRHHGAHFGFGHRRLSIVDLEGGHQPLSDASGRVWVTFNGEIYNYPSLRAELESHGCTFRTRSDTEVIVHGWLTWGELVMEHLDGMFAFGLWDERDGTLVLARDRLGIKPLLWARVPEALVFASELKGLLAAGLLPRAVRPAAVKRYLYHLYVPAPEGPLQDVQILPPAHALVSRSGRVQVRRYWNLSFAPAPTRSDTEWVEAFRCQLQASVASHLMSDVPVGAFLSGGVDSSTVVALMTAARGIDAPLVTTCTVGFDVPEYDESDDALAVARHLGTDHQAVRVTSAEIEAAVDEVLRCCDQPFADSSAVPTYLLCKATRSRVKVALAGDGADELLAGYPRFRHFAAMSVLDSMPAAIRRTAVALAGGASHVRGGLPARQARNLAAYLRAPSNGDRTGDMRRYVHLRNVFRGGWYERLLTPDFARSVAGDDPAPHVRAAATDSLAPNRLQRLLHVELATYLPNDILPKVDTASMAFGLEVRVPFLDHHLVEMVAGMPLHLKVNLSQTKVVMRRAFGDRLPHRTLRKRKQGFHLPVTPWFRGPGRDLLNDVLLSPRSLRRGYFEPAMLRQLVDEHVSSVADHGGRLWALLQLEVWHRCYVDAPHVGSRA